MFILWRIMIAVHPQNLSKITKMSIFFTVNLHHLHESWTFEHFKTIFIENKDR